MDDKHKPNVESEKKNAETDKNQQISMLTLATELGFSISIPIVALALIGRQVDKYYDTAPVFILTGIVLSMFVSVYIIYNKVKNVLK